MKTFSLILVLLFSHSLSISQNTDSDSLVLTVEVQGVKVYRGSVNFFLFDSEENFLQQPLQKQVVKLNTNASISVSFDGLPKGTYAVNVYHDKNGNDQLDLNWMRIPKEPYGFSKNKRGKMGPPRFDDVAVNLSSNDQIVINIK